MKGITNKEAIRKSEYWYSEKHGFVDLDEVDDEYFEAIVDFWQNQKKPELEAKIIRVQKHLRYSYSNNAAKKNAKRIAFIKCYDKLIQVQQAKRIARRLLDL